MNQPLKNGSFTRQFDGSPPRDVWPRFFWDTVKNELASAQAGIEIYQDVERVEYNMPSNPYSKPVQEVTDEHRQRWPKEYEAFKRGGEVAINGTPIDVLPFLKPAMVRTLKGLDIMTAEHLAGLNDHGLQRIPMGGRRLKELAQAYIDDTQAMAIVQKAQADSDRKDQRIAELELRVENMTAQMQTWFAQQQAAANAPPALMTAVPAASDPFEIMKMAKAAPEPAQSTFADLPAVPRRRRSTETPA